MSTIRPAILCGGSGTRLWPMSRTAKPKQLHALASEKSLLAETIARALAIPGVEPRDVMLIAGEGFALDLLRQEAAAGGAPDAEIIVEPSARNTAAACALAAHAAQARDADALVLILTSDHYIPDRAAFAKAVETGAQIADDGFIVTFGIKPTRPHEGYGHISGGEPLGAGFRVERFIEKPKEPLASQLFHEGRHLWNSGMFLFPPALYLSELEKFEPQVSAAVSAAFKGSALTGNVRRPERIAWEAAPKISIDNAVAERTDRAAIVPVDLAWSDIGSWDALWEIAERDASDNVLIGNVAAVDTSNSYIRAGDRLIALVGVSDLVVIDTGDVLAIAPRGRTEEVKKLVEALQAQGRKDLL